jgi:hypothetical protein
METSIESSARLFSAPSVGSLVKKMLLINPELDAARLIQMIRQSVRVQGHSFGTEPQAESVDEKLALELARKSLEGRN